jgi:RNA:NAD 2'-phosphotransferase (TPT1/KptA family)
MSKSEENTEYIQNERERKLLSKTFSIPFNSFRHSSTPKQARKAKRGWKKLFNSQYFFIQLRTFSLLLREIIVRDGKN